MRRMLWHVFDEYDGYVGSYPTRREALARHTGAGRRIMAHSGEQGVYEYRLAGTNGSYRTALSILHGRENVARYWGTPPDTLAREE